MEIPSETRSIYKLDSNALEVSCPDAPRTHGRGSALDKIFKNMPVVDRAVILDKINKMGLTPDKRHDYQKTKPGNVGQIIYPNQITGPEKDKMMAHFLA